MVTQFRNKMDNRRYAAAEDAFTSEGGFLALEDETLETHVDANRELRHPHRDFGKMVRRYATGMSAALTHFCGGSARPMWQPSSASGS